MIFRWILLKIAYSENKIGIKLYTYIILLTILMFYPSKKRRTHPYNDAKIIKNTPRSNINNIIIIKLTKWKNKVINNINGKIEAILTKRRISKRRIIARKITMKYTDIQQSKQK